MWNESQLNQRALKVSGISYAKSGVNVKAASDLTPAINAPPATTKVQATMGRRARSDLEIIGDILRVASRNGGESMSTLKQRTNLSQRTTTKYIRVMLARNLVSAEQPREKDSEVLYRPTELGYDFILRQRELLALLDSDGPGLFSFRDW